MGQLSSTTIIHALANQRVLTVTGSTITNSTIISGLTLANGRLKGISFTIDYGGGLLLISNTANFDGGGVYARDTANIVSGLFQDNSAFDVGGGLFSDGTLMLTDTRFINNSADSLGGGLNANGETTLLGGLFQNNSSTNGLGGGVYQTGSSTGRVVNALFTRNSVNSSNGAALYLSSTANTQVLHTTVASPAVMSGSAIYVVNGTVGISDTIVASHTIGIDIVSSVVYENYNLFFGNGANLSGAIVSGGNSLVGDPKFVNPASDDYHLSEGSAAIDMGVNVGVLMDFEDDGRPFGGFDIGFDEYVLRADLSIVKTVTPSVVLRGQPITYSIAFTNDGPQVALGVVVTDLVPSSLTNIFSTSSGAPITPTMSGW